MTIAQSDTYPATTAKSRGKTLYRWNIHEIEVTDEPGGDPRTAYEYNEVSISGKLTRDKILAAMRAAIDEVDTEDISDMGAQYESARKKLKSANVRTLPVPQLSEAVALILDVLGIEYDRT